MKGPKTDLDDCILGNGILNGRGRRTRQYFCFSKQIKIRDPLGCARNRTFPRLNRGSGNFRTDAIEVEGFDFTGKK